MGSVLVGHSVGAGGDGRFAESLEKAPGVGEGVDSVVEVPEHVRTIGAGDIGPYIRIPMRMQRAVLLRKHGPARRPAAVDQVLVAGVDERGGRRRDVDAGRHLEIADQLHICDTARVGVAFVRPSQLTEPPPQRLEECRSVRKPHHITASVHLWRDFVGMSGWGEPVVGCRRSADQLVNVHVGVLGIRGKGMNPCRILRFRSKGMNPCRININM